MHWHEELMKRVYKKCYKCIHFPVCERAYFEIERKNCKFFMDKKKR